MAHKPNSRIDLGPLHKILLAACPEGEDSPGSIKTTLAPALGVSHQYVYRWIEENRVPPKFVTKIVEAGAGRVTVEELIPFVIS